MKVARNIARLFGLVIALVAPLAIWWWWGTDGVRLIAAQWEIDSSANRLSHLGQAGDIFGGINALFAAYAFGGVAVAAYLQWRSWRLFVRQRIQDSFEPLFFHLITLARDTKPKKLIDLTLHQEVPFADAVTAIGTRVFPLIPKLAGTGSPVEREETLKPHYLAAYWRNESALGPYFRVLFHTFRRIKTSDLPLNKKLEYVGIARATLGPEDLLLLLLNGATLLGKDFKPLIEEYGLLKHIPKAKPGDVETKEQQLAALLYDPTATMSTSKRLQFWRENPRVAMTKNFEI
jgi:hypothetical protein